MNRSNKNQVKTKVIVIFNSLVILVLVFILPAPVQALPDAFVSVSVVYLPIISKPSALVPALNGSVNFNGSPASGVPLDLLFDDGSKWSTITSTTTAANGSYSFRNLPALSTGQKYYVFFANKAKDDSKLSSWQTKILTAYDGASIVTFETFDIANISLVSPDPWVTVSLPVTFTWTPRPATPSDSYEFDLYGPTNENPFFHTDPPLGYVSSYRLQSLPDTFSKGAQYGWALFIYSPDGGFGTSYSCNPIIFK
jgi:hypothetical protein